MEIAPSVNAVEPEASHRLQAAALWRRWKARRRLAGAAPAAGQVPAEATLPPEAWRHYRHFSWVIYEQRLVFLVLAFLLGASALVWSLAWHLQRKPPVVVRAALSLKEAAAAYYGTPEISYDQMVFFLHGCLPLLYAADDQGHPMLPLAQGLIAPEIYREAERRLDESEKDMQANKMTQNLTLTGVADVVADSKSGRAAARLRGYVTVTVHRAEAQFFPWRARVLLEVNPASRLNPYPFYLLRLEQRTGPEALAWDQTPDDADQLNPGGVP